MDALVLSGGNIRGAYQAGAIESVLAAGLRPRIITGTSVGALNAAFLYAYQPLPANGVTWSATGTYLTDFWLREITEPGKIARRRGFLELAWRVWKQRWHGIIDTDPLAQLVRRELTRRIEDVRQLGGDVRVEVTSVDLTAGALHYTPATSPRFLDAVLGSTAEPIGMPWRLVNGEPHYDGGMFEIAPLRRALELGATRVVAVLCQPEHPPGWTVSRDPLKIVSRVTQLVTYDILANDLRRMAQINRAARAYRATLPEGAPVDPAAVGYRDVPLTVVRPARGVPLDLEHFGPADIKRAVDLGRIDGAAAMARPPE